MPSWLTVVIVTATSVAALAALFMVGWQTTPSVDTNVRTGSDESVDVRPEKFRVSLAAARNDDAIEEVEKRDAATKVNDEKSEMELREEDEDSKLETWKTAASASVYSFERNDMSFFSLDGTWKVENQNGSISINGRVPGNVHTALELAGLIDDPYYRFNDVYYRWISYDSWSYSRSFSVDSSLVARKAVRLVCYGLDTVSNIKINGQLVGKTDNQFVGYVFDVTGILQEGENLIEVGFESAVEYAQKAFDSHSYVVPPTCPPSEYHPECHANFIRKAQCSFAWDWGPAFPTQGIWRSIGLEFYDALSIRSVSPQPVKDETGLSWLLNVSVEFDLANTSESFPGRLILSLPELSVQSETPLILTPRNALATVLLQVGYAESWWPRGYGAAKLYDFEVSFIPDDGSSPVTSTMRTGFRTIELVQDPVDAGLSFYFKINEVPIFMKGSNWIPMDSFLDMVTYDRLFNLLESAALANMNSIRIWGGGIYESEDFYDIADELGILVWQDMMFACSMYPVHEPFLDSVRDEIRYQVRRLGRHPSVTAWTANNENEGALVDNWYGTAGPNYPRYKADYVQLYIDVIRATILEEDVTRPFLPSSPSNGLVTEETGWISETPRPGAPDYGDVHFYNYVDDCMNLTIFPRTRYSSEYGYQSWPSYNTLTKIADPPQDLFYQSEFFNHREHHHGALTGTENIIRRHFVWPETGDQYRDFRSYIYLTQVAQAVCYQSQSEFYRRSRSDPSVATMGALYWQHNDIWQAPSWSTIDYSGQWKIAHYFAARFFADPIVSIVGDEIGLVSIFAVNDQLTNISDVQLVVQLWTWSNFSSLKNWTYTVDVPAEGAQKIFERPRSELLDEGRCVVVESCFLTAFIVNGSEQLTPSNAYYFVSWKEAVGMLDPDVQVADVSLDELDGTEVFRVSLTATAISAFVWLEAEDISGHFSDNGFLMTEATIQLDFHPWEAGLNADILRSSITITTLYSIYN